MCKGSGLIRADTKLIKKILRENYPNEKINVTYSKTVNQYTSGDKIYVEGNVNITREIIQLLYQYTKGIKISDVKFASIDSTGGQLFDKDSSKWIETDAIFIFINVKNNESFT